MAQTKKARRAAQARKAAAAKTQRYTVRWGLNTFGPNTTDHWVVVEQATGMAIPVTGTERGWEAEVLPLDWMADGYGDYEYLKPEFAGRHQWGQRTAPAITWTPEVEAACDRAFTTAREAGLI